MNRDLKVILLGATTLAILIVINAVLLTYAVKITKEKSCSNYKQSCGDFEYYVPETDQCVPFRNYEQEARYKWINKLEPMNQYKTSDIALATALIANGAKLEGVNKLGYSQAEFIISGYDLNSDVIEFQNRNLKVDAMTLFETHKSLKARANDVLRNQY